MRKSAVPLLSLLLLGAAGPAAEAPFDISFPICTPVGFQLASRPLSTLPVATCPPIPGGFASLPSIGDGTGDVSASLQIGYDPDTNRLCFAGTGLQLAPVLRVAAGHTLHAAITNTLHDTGPSATVNCPIDTYGGEGLCRPKPVFPERPGPDGPYYPVMANEVHRADGTFSLHVHGMFVPPAPCQDEVLTTTIYPANWGGPVGTLQPCQSAPDTLSYADQLPAWHPAGVYWFHTHRHGQTQNQTEMGLAGAIVVEDAGDAWRASLGVGDEVLLVTDIPNPACTQGPKCDLRINPHPGLQDRTSTSAAAAPGAPQSAVTLDPRIDQVNQAGCAYGASGPEGGVELWTLLLNGAPVPELSDGSFPPDSELLATTLQPGQRRIYRLVNASGNSFLVPQLVLNQNGVLTTQPLEIFARDGVGIADADGNRVFERRNVTKNPVVVPPAGRIEFVLHAPPAGAALYLQSAQFAPGCGGNQYPARRLLLITSAGQPVDPGPSDDHDLLQHTPSLAPYLARLGTTATVHRTFVFSEYLRGFTYGVTDWPATVPSQSDYDPSQTDYFVTEVASDDGEVNPGRIALKPFMAHQPSPPQVVVHLNGQQSVTEEWLIENSTLEAHSFHIHQLHFRDITAGGTGPDAQPILDTVTVPPAPLVGSVQTGHPGTPPGYVRLLLTFTTADIGTFLYHCHMMEHEDDGMMGVVKVVAN